MIIVNRKHNCAPTRLHTILFIMCKRFFAKWAELKKQEFDLLFEFARVKSRNFRYLNPLTHNYENNESELYFYQSRNPFSVVTSRYLYDRLNNGITDVLGWGALVGCAMRWSSTSLWDCDTRPGLDLVALERRRNCLLGATFQNLEQHPTTLAKPQYFFCAVLKSLVLGQTRCCQSPHKDRSLEPKEVAVRLWRLWLQHLWHWMPTRVDLSLQGSAT